MNFVLSFKPMNIRIGTLFFKRGNRSEIHRRIPVYNDPDDYDDVGYYTKAHEAPGMSSRKNNRRNNNHFLLKFVASSLIIGVIVLIWLQIWLIPKILQGYNQIQGNYRIATLIVQYEQKINPRLLARLTYLNANGQWQTTNVELQGNAAILVGDYLDLPGFGEPGGRSGSKLIGVDLQHIGAVSTPNDPPQLSNNAIQLNGGAGVFFNILQNIPIVNALLNVSQYTLVIKPIRESQPQCYNVYMKVEPQFTLSAQHVTGTCISPFTHPLP